jgi:hypothetical protein
MSNFWFSVQCGLVSHILFLNKDSKGKPSCGNIYEKKEEAKLPNCTDNLYIQQAKKPGERKGKRSYTSYLKVYIRLRKVCLL